MQDSKLAELKRRQRALEAAWNAPFMNSGDTDSSLVTKLCAYGHTTVDTLNLKEEEAVVLAQIMMQHENFSPSKFSNEDFDDTVKGAWPCYRTYKTALSSKQA